MKTFKEGKKKGVHEGTSGSLVTRPLQMSDFEAALLKLKKAGELYGDHISLVFINLNLCAFFRIRNGHFQWKVKNIFLNTVALFS